MGYVFALCSVMLVTLAQLMLRWSMVRLPGIQEIAGQWQQLSLPAVIALCAGLLAYTLSMLCWMLDAGAQAYRAQPGLSAAQPELCAGVAAGDRAADLLRTFPYRGADRRAADHYRAGI